MADDLISFARPRVIIMKVKISALTAIISAFALLIFAFGCGNSSASSTNESTLPAATPEKTNIVAQKTDSKMDAVSNDEYKGEKIVNTEAEWRKQLTPEQFYILRKEGTEQPYTGEYNDNHETGDYHCAACGLKLFSSKTKFESGTGWPSFYQPIAAKNVTEHVDKSLGEMRTEIECSRCGSHLGHVFDDGPQPTGLRYCMNSVALKFEKAK